MFPLCARVCVCTYVYGRHKETTKKSRMRKFSRQKIAHNAFIIIFCLFIFLLQFFTCECNTIILIFFFINWRTSHHAWVRILFWVNNKIKIIHISNTFHILLTNKPPCPYDYPNSFIYSHLIHKTLYKFTCETISFGIVYMCKKIARDMK